MVQSGIPLVSLADALDDLCRARQEFERAFQDVPVEALGYRPEGDEYALGGLLVHVTEVLKHYVKVLDGILGAAFDAVRIPTGPANDRERVAQMRSGLNALELPDELDNMRSAHAALERRMRALPEEAFTRAAPVFYGAEAAEPSETRPADVTQRATDHYREHVPHIAALLDSWRLRRT